MIKLSNRRYFSDWKKLHFEFRKYMRYDDVGDWLLSKNVIYIYDEMSDEDKLGVMVHEFIEMIVLGVIGITENDIYQMDLKIKKRSRKYKDIHNLANRIEKMVLEKLGIDWKEHQKRIKKIKVNVK